MIAWRNLSLGYSVSLLVAGMLAFLLAMHIMVWNPMGHSIQELQQDVARLDQETQNLIQKITSMESLRHDITDLRKTLSSRVQQFPDNLDIQIFRREVVKIAKRRHVIIRVWKPETPLVSLQYSETAIPITVRVEGNFPNTVQFLDELRRLLWVKNIASLLISIKEESEGSPLIITNLGMQGFTPSGIEHLQSLIKA